jgi:hypothetical protein
VYDVLALPSGPVLLYTTGDYHSYEDCGFAYNPDETSAREVARDLAAYGTTLDGWEREIGSWHQFCTRLS